MEQLARATVWAERAWGRRVEDLARLRGGWTSTMLLLTAEDGARAVLRLMTREPWRTHAPGLLAREVRVLALLAGTPVPAPRSLALDATGDEAGEPAHLMSHLPGSLELRSATDGVLVALAAALRRIHAVDPGEDRPREYQSWAPPAKRVVPPWAGEADVWREAFARLAAAPPRYDGCFLHRDFHLGNVLWDGGRVSGVVDWVETSWGPPGLDVAHASTYLSLLHGADTADRFAAAYGPLPEGQAHWDLLDAVGYLPDPTKVATPWRDLGVGVSDELARERLEARVAQVLSRVA